MSKNRKDMLKERLMKSELLQNIRRVNLHGKLQMNSLEEEEQTRVKLKQRIQRTASKSGKIIFRIVRTEC